jgi:cytochrome c biogenesis DsbD-like protein
MQCNGFRTIAIVLACGAALAAQAPPPRQTPLDKDKDLVGQVVTRHLRINLRFAEPAVTPGAQATLVAEVLPAARMHVYAPGQQNYISVELKLAPSPSYKPAPPAFPAAKSLYLEAIRETVQVYDAPFQITQVVTLADTADLRRRAAARETLAIAGTFRYQACDDTVCYRPETTPISWKVPLARAK